MTRSEAKKIWLKHADEHKEQGQSETEVAASMGCSSVSDYRATRARYKHDLRAEELADVVETLRTGTTATSYLDVGFGASRLLGISQDRLRTALAILKEEGFAVYIVEAEHRDPAKELKATVKVLAPPGTSYRDIVENKQKISHIKKEDSNA